jgi:hypothetical protein
VSISRPLVSVLFTVSLAGCMGYVPGRQAYWDVQVEKMCKNDGGVAILERLRSSEQSKARSAFQFGSWLTQTHPFMER